MTLDNTDQGDQQEDGPDGHVGTVKAGEQEEQAAVDPCIQSQTHVIGVHIFQTLQAQEDGAQYHGDGLEDDQLAALVFQQSVVGNGQGDGADQQDSGVDGRQAPSAHGRGGATVRGHRKRPHGLETRPQ